jgi:hypothetical protein
MLDAGDASVIVTATRHACAVPCMAACDTLMGKTKLYVRDDAVRLDRLAAVCVFVSPVQTTVLAS